MPFMEGEDITSTERSYSASKNDQSKASKALEGYVGIGISILIKNKS